MQPAEMRPYAELSRPEQIQAQLAICHEGVTVPTLSMFVGAKPEEVQKEIEVLGLKPLTRGDSMRLKLDRTAAELSEDQKRLDIIMNANPELATLKVWEIPEHIAGEKYNYAKKGVEEAQSIIKGVNRVLERTPAEELDHLDLFDGAPKYGIIEREKTLAALRVDPKSASERLTAVLMSGWKKMEKSLKKGR